MAGLCASRGVGVYVASETHNVAWGRTTKPAAPVVVYLQGSHSLADDLFSGELARAKALAKAGFMVVSGDLSQTTSQGTFGNDTARTRVGQLVTFAQGSTAPIRGRAGKVWLLGVSGGATAAVNYARQNPATVAAMYLEVPLLDLQDFYSNKVTQGGSAFTQAEIDTAYGGAFAANVASHSPVVNASDVASIPVRLAYSEDDQYVSTASVSSFASATGASVRSLGSVLHNPASVDPNDVVSFFRDHP